MESDADAEVLLWEVQVADELDQDEPLSIRDHFMRIKVFTQKGAQDWSSHDIDYPRQGVRVTGLVARTIRPDGSIRVMEKSAIKDETIVKTSEGSEKRITFAIPAVEPGCIIEYRYREHRRNDDIYSSSYPLQITIPVEKVVYRVKPLEYPGLVMRQLIFHAAAESKPRPVNGYYETIALNVPAFTTEPDMPPEAQQLGFMVLFYTRAGNHTPDTFWLEVGKARAERFNSESKPDDPMRKAARSLVEGATSDRERVERIARWMRKEFTVVRSDARDSLKARGLAVPDGAREAWRQRGGRYADALLVFAALSRAAGLDVRWVMVPSRSEIFFNRNMLYEGFLNTYQVAVRLPGGWQTFDPVTRYLPWDMRPWDEESSTGLLCDEDSSRFVVTDYSGPEHSVRSRSADLTLAADGTLEGTVRVSWSGHLNGAMRVQFSGTDAAEVDSLATRSQTAGGTTIEVSDARLLRGTEESSPFGLTARVAFPQFASVTGKRILLEPAVFFAHEKPRFTSSARKHPVYFRYPWTELDTVRVRLPEGWKVETADVVEPVAAPGVADYAAQVMVSDDETHVLYVRRFRMGIDGNIFFLAQDYPGVKQLFDEVQKRDRVSLSLARADGKP